MIILNLFYDFVTIYTLRSAHSSVVVAAVMFILLFFQQFQSNAKYIQHDNEE